MAKMWTYPVKGVSYFDHNIQAGLATRRRNPKKKSRLPYHAKRHLNAPIIGAQPNRTCNHGLTKHEEIEVPGGNLQTFSYAMPCISKHSSPKVPHRDSAGRKW